jgi:two-component system, NtrC family, response regulator AtoC
MMTNGLESVMVREERDFVGGMCMAMQTLENVLGEIAPTNIPVLLVGESGTGKAVFAHRLHRLSSRSEERLVSIACAAMNPTLLTSELCLAGNTGSEFRDPDNSIGTVFLEEISELDSGCQRNLLYALPGDGAPRRGSLSARVISTTTRNLDEEMRAGRFRSELYYRINGVCLRLPPLRDRREDIPILVEFFLTKHAALFARPRPSVSARTMRILLDHSWPGNIRELENVIKKVVALGDEQLAVSELTVAPVERLTPVEISEPRGYSLKEAARAASREAEKELILKALAHTRWNRKRAAQELQISYKSLLYKLKQIGVQDAETEQRG